MLYYVIIKISIDINLSNNVSLNSAKLLLMFHNEQINVSLFNRTRFKVFNNAKNLAKAYTTASSYTRKPKQ